MMFGMTRGEIGLVLFIFALVYGATFLPRLGDALGDFLAKRLGGPRPRD
jgi:Sec-independent protein translocase protein TatA